MTDVESIKAARISDAMDAQLSSTPPRPRFVRKQSIVDVMGSDDLLESIQTQNLDEAATNFPEIDQAIDRAVNEFSELTDGDAKLQREVELIKYLIHKAKTILDDAAHSPMLDRETLTVLSCNVNAVAVDDLMKVQGMFNSEKCFYCLRNLNYCSDINHDSVRCIFEDSISALNQIEGIIRKYGHKNLRQYELHDMLSVYKMYREKGLVN